MSDCTMGGRFTHHWTNQVWHSPSGRAIHIDAGDEPHEVELEYPDGTHRYIHYAGDLPSRVRIDGAEYGRVDS